MLTEDINIEDCFPLLLLPASTLGEKLKWKRIKASMRETLIRWFYRCSGQTIRPFFLAASNHACCSFSLPDVIIYDMLLLLRGQQRLFHSDINCRSFVSCVYREFRNPSGGFAFYTHYPELLREVQERVEVLKKSPVFTQMDLSLIDFKTVEKFPLYYVCWRWAYEYNSPATFVKWVRKNHTLCIKRSIGNPHLFIVSAVMGKKRGVAF